MIQLATPEIWFITGSRHLYGPETLNHYRRRHESARIPARLAHE
jgi:L-arabinose isomerase